jgi:hypothetical protein
MNDAVSTIVSFKSKELVLENLEDNSGRVRVIGTNYAKEHTIGELIKYTDLKGIVENNFSILINGLENRRIVMRVLRNNEEEFGIANYYFDNKSMPISQIVECGFNGKYLFKGIYAGNKEIVHALENRCTLLIDQRIDKIETMIRGKHNDTVNIGLAYSRDTRNYDKNIQHFRDKY